MTQELKLGAVDAARMVQAFSGPALVVDASRNVLVANANADRLSSYMERAPGSEGLPDLIRHVAAFGAPASGQVKIPVSEEDPYGSPATLDLTLLPCTAGGKRGAANVLILARDRTMEANLFVALKESRKLYQDLAECGSDFTWQTDSEGKFVFASATGIAGFSGAELHGRTAADLVWSSRSPGSGEAFTVRKPTDDHEIVLQASDGTPCHLKVSARPVLDSNGKWVGTRGSARDITELRSREAELAAEQARHQAVRHLADCIQHETEPNLLLENAVRAAANAAGTPGGWLFRLSNDFTVTGPSVACLPGRRDKRGPDLREIVDSISRARMPLIRNETEDGWRIVGIPTLHGDRPNGVLCLGWPIDEVPAPDPSWVSSVLERLAGHTALAILQASQLERLNTLANTDQTTGLLTQSALMREGAQLVKQQRQIALLSIAFDQRLSFDTAAVGAGGGDAEAIDDCVRMVTDLSRRHGLAGRLSDNELGLLLIDADAPEAVLAADSLVESFGNMDTDETLLGGAGERTKLMIGVAVFEPDSNELLEELLDRARGAREIVASSGSSNWQLADRPAKPSAKETENERRTVAC